MTGLQAGACYWNPRKIRLNHINSSQTPSVKTVAYYKFELEVIFPQGWLWTVLITPNLCAQKSYVGECNSNIKKNIFNLKPRPVFEDNSWLFHTNWRGKTFDVHLDPISKWSYSDFGSRWFESLAWPVRFIAIRIC